MAKASEASNTAKTETERVDYLGMLQSNGANLDAAMKATDAMMKGMAAFGQEIVEFANARLRQNIETSQSLMGCSDITQAFGLQCDFARNATQQYLEEASKLMTLAAEVTRETWEPIEARTRETLTRLNNR
jgi:hypothetical protein